MSAKKKILIGIIVFLVLCILIALGLFLTSIRQQTNTEEVRDNTENTATVNSNENQIYEKGRSSSQTISNINDNTISDEDDINIEDTQYDTEDNYDTDIDYPVEENEPDLNEQTLPNIETSDQSDLYPWKGETSIPNRSDGYINYDEGSQNNAYPSDIEKLNTRNRELLSNTSINFINTFLNYNKDTVANNSYLLSVQPLIPNYDKASDKNMIARHMSETWLRDHGLAPETFSQVLSVNVEDVYISHLTYEDSVAVRVSATVRHNQGDPGELDWAIVQTYAETYCIYFDNSDNIIAMQRTESYML